MKRAASAVGQAVPVGVWPSFGISTKVARRNRAAAWRPAELGVLASRSPERTSTGTSGICVPGASGEPAVGSSGHSMQLSTASNPACVQPLGENGQNSLEWIAASARS